MIAVFSKKEQFQLTEFFPKHKFKLIKNHQDVRGVKFTGIVLLTSGFEDQAQKEAHLQLFHRQPELFRKGSD